MRRWEGANGEAYHAPEIMVNPMIVLQFWPFTQVVSLVCHPASLPS